MALGHEGVGIVEATGPDCKYLKKGDRVGWGYEHDSCGHCEQCLKGNESYCPERAMYGIADLDQGSFAKGAVWRETFLYKIPDGLSDEDAAPLMCGGATAWNALHVYDTQPTDTVGIMGVGGLGKHLAGSTSPVGYDANLFHLGHLAIQFAANMGCRVVVLSGSDKKKDEALSLGAHEFVATKGAKELKVSHPLNRLVVTTSAQPDWNLILPIMAVGSTIHPLSVSEGNFSIPYMPLLLNGIRVQGSIIPSRYVHKRMLDFALLHKIKPVIQKFPMTVKGIEEAMDKLDKGEIRYRGVIVPQ